MKKRGPKNKRWLGLAAAAGAVWYFFIRKPAPAAAAATAHPVGSAGATPPSGGSSSDGSGPLSSNSEGSTPDTGETSAPIGPPVFTDVDGSELYPEQGGDGNWYVTDGAGVQWVFDASTGGWDQTGAGSGVPYGAAIDDSGGDDSGGDSTDYQDGQTQ